jgi:hypothetical protein
MPALTSTKTVTNGTVPTSGPVTFIQAGALYWKVVYSGESLNAGAASPCIALTVTKATPTLSLSLSPNPVVAGRTVSGAATLANGVNSPGGTATYTVYANNTCTTPVTPAQTSTKTVTNGSAPNSDALAFNLAGTFYWRVSYSGDANNNPVASLCVALNVAKTTATLAMTQVPSPVNLGDSLTAHFTLSADAVSPTGTVTLSSYSDASCTTAQAGLGPQTVTLVNGQIPDPPAVVFTISTDVYRQATYSGDANNAAATTSCQLVAVAQDLPLGLTVSPATTVFLGASVSAQANWPSDETPTGTVTYTAYATADCTGAAYAGPQTSVITANSVAVSSARAFGDAGGYSWQAAYSGDDFYNPTSICVPLTVLKLTPTLSLAVAPNPTTAGGAVTATATLTGATSTAGGSVTYTVYADNMCATPVTPAQISTKTVTNGAVPTSDLITMSRAGVFYWRASYTGDPNNAATTSACLALTVGKASPTLTLSVVPNPVTAGGTVTGKATLSGAVSAANGTVTYTVYTGSTCATQLSVTNNPSTKSVTNGTVPASDPMVFDQAGTYSWKAVYSGDPNNNPAASACVAATVVPAGTAAVALTVAPNPVVVGNGATGSVTLSGVTTTAGGTVTYTVYTNANCTTQVTPTQTATRTVTNGAAPNSSPFTFTQVGTVYWQAVYSGDASNSPAASPCVALNVTQASPTLSLTVTPGAIMVWDTATGSATLTGATANAGGTATYTIYTDNTCATPVTPAQTATRSVTNGAIPGVTFQFDFSGAVYWRVTYTGDANNNGTVGPCLPLTVAAGSLTASVAAATLPPVNYSTAAQTTSGTLALTVTDQRGTADGWSVALSISDFAYSGPSPSGTAIPAGAFSVTAANAPSVVRGQPLDSIAGPAPPGSGATGPLDQPVVVLVAADGSGAGVYTQGIDVTLTIPANSQTGIYRAVLETVTSAAP